MTILSVPGGSDPRPSRTAATIPSVIRKGMALIAATDGSVPTAAALVVADGRLPSEYLSGPSAIHHLAVDGRWRPGEAGVRLRHSDGLVG